MGFHAVMEKTTLFAKIRGHTTCSTTGLVLDLKNDRDSGSDTFGAM